MLTPSQLKTLRFIQQFIEQNEYAPTTSEIAHGIGIRSRGVVHRYLKALAAKGAITLKPNRHRNIRLPDVQQDAMSIKKFELPLVGTIAAGQPIEAISDRDTLELSSIFLGDGRYALRVKGDSMIDEGILDGDIIIAERTVVAKDGDVVVALIDQQEATLKRLQRNANGTITLIPANKSLSPMVFEADRVMVQGVFVGLLRLS